MPGLAAIVSAAQNGAADRRLRLLHATPLVAYAPPASGHATAAPPSRADASFEYLVGERQQLVLNLETERLGGLEVDEAFVTNRTA